MAHGGNDGKLLGHLAGARHRSDDLAMVPACQDDEHSDADGMGNEMPSGAAEHSTGVDYFGCVEAYKCNRTIAAEWVLLGQPLPDLVLIRVMKEPHMAISR